jgi:hypothetical protein
MPVAIVKSKEIMIQCTYKQYIQNMLVTCIIFRVGKTSHFLPCSGNATHVLLAHIKLLSLSIWFYNLLTLYL